MKCNIWSNRVAGFYSKILCTLATISYFKQHDNNSLFRIDTNLLGYGDWCNFYTEINQFDGNADISVSDDQVWYHYVKNDSTPSDSFLRQLSVDALPYLKYSKQFQEYRDTFQDITNYITLHFRGSLANWHTPYVPEESYIPIINEKYNDIDNILICTDDNNAVNNFKRLLPNKNIIHNSTFTKQGGEVHLYKPPTERVGIGFEVMRDSIFMSKSKAVIGKGSNVSSFAKILNSDLQINYII